MTDDLGGEARSVIDYLKERTGVELTEEEVLDSPHLFIGSIDRFVEKFEALRERLGISSFMVGGARRARRRSWSGSPAPDRAACPTVRQTRTDGPWTASRRVATLRV